MALSIVSRRIGVAGLLVALGGAFVAPQVASAHSISSSANCTGVTGNAFNYNLVYTNTMTIFIDGVAAAGPQNFPTNHQMFAANPDQTQSHTWQVIVTTTGPTHQYNENHGTIERCVEPTTTTSTTTSTTSTTTSTTSTTTAPTTTRPTTTGPTTTQPEATTTDPAPTTTRPEVTTTTDPAPTTTRPEVTTTQPEVTTTDPAPTTTQTSGGGGTSPGTTRPAPRSTLAPPLGQLPSTGSSSAPVAVTAGSMLLAGGLILFGARRSAAVR